jgi:hypothetical protein
MEGLNGAFIAGLVISSSLPAHTHVIIKQRIPSQQKVFSSSLLQANAQSLVWSVFLPFPFFSQLLPCRDSLVWLNAVYSLIKNIL